MTAPSTRALPHLWEPEVATATSGDTRDVSRVLRIGIAFLGLLVLLAAFVPIGGAVVGTGQVGVEERVKRIAHPFGGVIREILVSNGQHVGKGDTLLILDDTVSGADANYASLSAEQLLAQQARLDAERLGVGRIVFPPSLTRSASRTAQQAMRDEMRLFNLRRAEQAQLQAQLVSRVAQIRQEIAGIDAQIASLRRQSDLIEPERAGVRELWEKDLVTISRMNQMERSAADIEGRIGALAAQKAQAQAEITETRERAIQLDQTRRVEAGTEMARISATLNEQMVRQVQAGDQQDRSRIRAPYAGTVEKIAFAAVGDVIRGAEPIMEIVPDSGAMVVEASISPADIDQVRVGQRARIRFSSFNLAATPEISGTVSYVATDRSTDPEGKTAFYTARLTFDAGQARAERLDLRSGMPAEVHIETGSRSMLSYITKPLRDQLARAFRDG